MDHHVRIVHEPRRRLVVTAFRTTAAALGGQIGPAVDRVREFLARHNAPPAGPAVVYIEVDGPGLLAAVGFTVPRHLTVDGDVMTFELPEADVATTTHLGGRHGLSQAYDALSRGAYEQGRQLDESGGMWEEHWGGDGAVDEPRIEVFWPLRPA